MARSHTMGFPRIGRDRELKKVLEAYWQGDMTEEALREQGRALRAAHWAVQKQAGIDLLPVGDFAWYDQVLTHSLMLGAIPQRHRPASGAAAGLDTLFAMSRGVSRCGCGHESSALEMTKWFDTNYHYLVPELEPEQTFALSWTQLFEEVDEAKALGYDVKPVVLGPLTWLWLAKTPGRQLDKLTLLEAMLPVYHEIFTRLAAQGVAWVQLDEPVLVLDLPVAWRQAFERVYFSLQRMPLKKMLATYFGGLLEQLPLAASLPVDGLHIDLVRAPEQLIPALDQCRAGKVLSLGVVNGRNIWRNDFSRTLPLLQKAAERLGERLWIAPSCSLLHTPYDVAREQRMDEETRQWLAFAVQKCEEVALLTEAVNTPDAPHVLAALAQNQALMASRAASRRIHKTEVQQRLDAVSDQDLCRQADFASRITMQHTRLNLPLLPTTTIGSFPQTADIRAARQAFKQGRLDVQAYEIAMKREIAHAIAEQEKIGLDVLVHGEAERNDMVEYFAEQLDGFAFTQYGWVQSYGSRCVKPAVIYGDISRPKAMTVKWISHAQSLTQKVVKGMLTGPVTMLMWSFAREDVTREVQAKQLALAIRDEVQDLQAAGICIIQIDEAAFREGLPLRKEHWRQYLDWAVAAFRLCSSGVRNDTQIHTHMCYSEFNDVIAAIAAMDADVITIETSRSHMELLNAFRDFKYPNEIGPGVYDIHSPRVPEEEEIMMLIQRAAELIPVQRLWINPDCGLKTRAWPETVEALTRMVKAARRLREAFTKAA